MSPNIDLDDDVFDFLKSNAEPFVDTPNTVLRRLLGMEGNRKPATTRAAPSAGDAMPSSGRTPKSIKKSAKTAAPKRTRAAAGTLLPEHDYERPLLKALVDAGGQAAYRDVVDAVGRELKDKLMEADFEKLSSGAIRWQSRLQFVRLRLVGRGFLDKDAPRGVWGITDTGRSALQEGEGI